MSYLPGVTAQLLEDITTFEHLLRHNFESFLTTYWLGGIIPLDADTNRHK